MVATAVTVLLLLFMAALCSGAPAPRASTRTKVLRTREYLSSLDQANLLAGNMAVYSDGMFQLQTGLGYAVPDIDVRLKPSHSLYIGSNTKFFTAVALWQLYARGLIDLDAPVSNYMDPKDFNRTEAWCPQMHGNTSNHGSNSTHVGNSTECIVPTAKQLLMMSSGMVAVDGCDDGLYDSNDWQSEYCIPGDKWSTMINDSLTATMTGGSSPAQFFVASGTYDAPLEAMPGTEYQYVNANFLLATYLIEKVSNMSYGHYLREHILVPANISTTASYEYTNGNNGVQKGCVPHPGYRTIFSPVSKDYVDAVNRTSSFNLDPLLDVPAGQFVGNAKAYDAPGWQGFASGAGAICAQPKDVINFWLVVLFRPETIGLNVTVVREMLNSYNPVQFSGPLYYSQGTVVLPNPSYKPYGIENIMYIGGVPGNVGSPFVLRLLDRNNPTKDNTFAAGGIFTNTNELQAPFNATTCQVWDWRKNNATSTLPPKLCEAVAAGDNYAEIVVMSNVLQIWTNLTWVQFLIGDSITGMNTSSMNPSASLGGKSTTG